MIIKLIKVHTGHLGNQPPPTRHRGRPPSFCTPNPESLRDYTIRRPFRRLPAPTRGQCLLLATRSYVSQCLVHINCLGSSYSHSRNLKNICFYQHTQRLCTPRIVEPSPPLRPGDGRGSCPSHNETDRSRLCPRCNPSSLPASVTKPEILLISFLGKSIKLDHQRHPIEVLCYP